MPSLDNFDARLESILAKIPDEPAAETQAAAPGEAAQDTVVVETAGEPGPDGTPVTAAEAAQPDPAEPVIEPPASWKADAKDRFKSLPRDLQTVIADREAEQRATFNRQVNEAAERTRQADLREKAAADSITAATQQQQSYAQQLASYAQQMEALDPVIATWNRIDREKLAREQPAQYTELHAAYTARTERLTAIRAEQSRVQTEAYQASVQREEKALLAKVPDWANPEVGHRALNEIRQGAVSTYGFTPEQVRVFADHRHALILRDALDAPKLRAKVAELEAKVAEGPKVVKQAIADKKVTPAPAKVLKPGSSSESTEKVAADRDKAIINRAKKARNLHDKASILADL